jgi:hypothetical protein
MLDLDVRAFFDSVPHDLLLKAVAHHTDERWVLLYIERWLKAPMSMPDGTLVAREKGTPQGGLCAAAHNPPWGVPVQVPRDTPSSERTPAIRNALTRRRRRRSPIRLRTRSIRAVWSMRSKHASMSPSSTHS